MEIEIEICKKGILLYTFFRLQKSTSIEHFVTWHSYCHEIASVTKDDRSINNMADNLERPWFKVSGCH